LRGNHRQAIFRDSGDYHDLERYVKFAVEDYDLRVHAYCWMPNHIHLAIQVSQTPLGRPMARIASSYARSYQKRQETTGHLFERRYHAALVDSDRYLFSLVRYIHQNPVRAGLVRDPALFQWSSHEAYLSGRAIPWLTTGTVLGKLSSNPARARAEYLRLMSAEPAAEELALLRGSQRCMVPAEKTPPRPPPAAASPSFDALVNRICVEFRTEPATL
jgi:REP element-mobilizing transposase RayT